MIIHGQGPHEIQSTDKKGELVRIALKAMATEPAERYPDVKAFQQALRDYRQHAESIVLATRAKEHLARLQQSQAGEVYRECNEAISGYRQALALWDGNVPAVKGLRRAREALAQCALERGDLVLARSEVDAIRAECREFLVDGAGVAGARSVSRLQVVPSRASGPPCMRLQANAQRSTLNAQGRGNRKSHSGMSGTSRGPG
jgi:hypothetical protein